MHKRMHTYSHACTHACIHTHIHAHKNACTHACMHMRNGTHTHTHTLLARRTTGTLSPFGNSTCGEQQPAMRLTKRVKCCHQPWNEIHKETRQRGSCKLQYTDRP